MADGVGSSRWLSRDGAGPYVIQVWGQVERHWEPELRMSLSYAQTETGVVTTFSGQLPDQAALLGALNRLAMWGYVIILVRYEAALSARGNPCAEP